MLLPNIDALDILSYQLDQRRSHLSLYPPLLHEIIAHTINAETDRHTVEALLLVEHTRGKTDKIGRIKEGAKPCRDVFDLLSEPECADVRFEKVGHGVLALENAAVADMVEMFYIGEARVCPGDRREHVVCQEESQYTLADEYRVYWTIQACDRTALTETAATDIRG